ncbi:MAG: transglutaminase domain-containing protein [Anaerolineales bacterium]|nr:transglutaminase domain-containing protein [Anaerolineales bacterium]
MTEWARHLSITIPVMYLGLLAGVTLGISRFNKTRCFLFSVYYGIFFIVWQLGTTINQDFPWYERLIIIKTRIGVTTTQLIEQKPVTDNLFFLLLMASLFWILSSYAGFTFIRYADPWKIIIPSGLSIVILHSYDYYVTKKIWALVVYLFFVLILMIRFVYLHQRQKWRSSKTYIPSNTGLLFLRVAVISAMLLLIIVWVAPVEAKSFQTAVNAWEQIKRPFKEIRQNFVNAFASLQSSVGIVPEYYSSSLDLGRGASLSDDQLFTVLTPENVPDGTRFYWRVRVYESYEDGQWRSMASDSVSVEPANTNLQYPVDPGRRPNDYIFYFTSVRPISTLFLVPQPLWVSVPAQAELVVNEDDTVDIFAIKAAPYLPAGSSYRTRASLAGATILAMQEAGEEYPDWVTKRYLQLPASMTQRTKDLALEITQEQPTPYDKAKAITNFLRNSIKYSETIPNPPGAQDVIDWFLFDHREGFCNYYATAQVILLRSLGIPARLAAGYAQGEPIELTNTYLVKHRDAHAWPEVYFPGLGWIEFEPTASQPILDRPSGEIQDIAPEIPVNPQNNHRIEPEREESMPVQDTPLPENQSPLLVILKSLLAGSVIAALIIVGILVLKSNKIPWQSLPPFPVFIERALRKIGLAPPEFIKKWAYRASLPAISQAYLKLNESLARLGNLPNPNKTPRERAFILGNIIPELSKPAHTLVNQYELATYGISSPDIISAQVSSQQIQRLIFREYVRRLLGGSTPHLPEENNSDS